MSQIIETGAQGNCLFSSIGFFLGKPHDIVRSEIVQYMREKCKEILFSGLRLCCAIKAAEGIKKRAYFERMSRLGEQGGEIEIFVASLLYRAHIKVYDQNMKLAYEYKNGEQEIGLRYSSGHYQAVINQL
jgi:hypothetical protein